MAALRTFKRIAEENRSIGWEPPEQGGYGLPDSFNLQLQKASHDTLGIDAGPFLLGIENARTGLIWKLFHRHPVSRNAVRLLQFKLR